MASCQVHVVLFGPPGVGKGTQSELLKKNRNMLHVSTGNILRDHIAESTHVGLKVKQRMANGDYVSDDVVLELVDMFIGENEQRISDSGGVVFDGFPRTFGQAKGLDDILKKRSMKLGLAIFLELEHKTLLGRLTSRRCCEDCGAVFRFHGSKSETCDSCGGKLYKRPDDEDDVVLNRLNKYETATLPLKEYYSNLGIYKGLTANGNVKDVSSRINSLIDEILLA